MIVKMLYAMEYDHIAELDLCENLPHPYHGLF